MMSGVRASSTRIESTSSMMQKLNGVSARSTSSEAPCRGTGGEISGWAERGVGAEHELRGALQGEREGSERLAEGQSLFLPL